MLNASAEMTNSGLSTPLSAEPSARQSSLLTVASSSGLTGSQTSLQNGLLPTSSQPPQTKKPNHKIEPFILEDKNLERPPRRGNGFDFRGWTKFILRSFKLLVFRYAVATHVETSFAEEEKVAIRKDRRHAALYGLIIHLLPAGAAITLIVLNSTQYYVGGELAGPSGQDDEKLGALTFVAKLHELLMLASLAAFVFAYFRRELLYGEGLPYGAVSGGLQFKEFNFLYSPELWSAFCADWKTQRKKWTLIILLVVCTMLGVSVGPSTNNLMRPRLDWWDAGGTTFWVDAKSSLLLPNKTDFLSGLEHCKVDTGDAACPHGGWELISQHLLSYWPRLEPMGNMPETLDITSPLSTRQMIVRHRSMEDARRSIWQNAFSSASVQQSVVADGVAEVGRLWAYAAANAGERQKFGFRKDAQYAAYAPQPITITRCEERVFPAGNISSFQLSFPIFPALPSCHGDDSACFSDPLSFFTVSDNDTLTETVTTALSTGGSPQLTWVEADVVPLLSNSSIHAIATFPSSTSGDGLVYCCTIDSVYAQAELLGTRNMPKIVTGYPSDMLGRGTFIKGARRITISEAWAKLLFPKTPLSTLPNATTFTQMASAAGMWNSSLASQSYNFPFIVESILSTSVTNGLARATYNKTLLGTLKGNSEDECDGTDWCGGAWVQEMMPKLSLGRGGSAFNIDNQDQQRATMFTMRASVYGYAWSSAGMLQKAALTVLSIYSCFAVSHFIYLVKSGYISLAWEKAPEIISLAMNSQPTALLYNTGAGIDTIKPYKAKVRIRVNSQGHLEYIFEDTQGCMDIVEPNKRYA